MDSEPIVQEAGWVAETAWMNVEKRQLLAPVVARTPKLPIHSESLYRLRYPARCNYYKIKTQPPLIVKQKAITGRDIDIAVGGGVTETAYSVSHKIPSAIHSNSSMPKQCYLLQCLEHKVPCHRLPQYKQHAKMHLSVSSTRGQDLRCRHSVSSTYI